MFTKFFVFLTLAIAAFCCSTAANAQKRDSLTEAEIEIVRDAQAIDARTAVFVKAIDRRFAALNIQTHAADDKKLKKEAEIWGEPPTGTRLALLTDIKKILESAIDNIDNVAAHDSLKDEKLFNKAVRKLAEAANRFLPELTAELDKTTSEKEKGALLSSIESCEQIVEASAKIPKEEVKEKKKKNDN